MTEHVHDEGCICRGNWRAIVKETEHLIGDKYTNSKEEVFSFFGIVHGGDDYYYGMWRKGQLNLLSCVGSIEGHGYTRLSKVQSRDL